MLIFFDIRLFHTHKTMEKILVIEDSLSIRESVENYLKLNDYEVVACDNCQDSARALETFSPDLAVVDISLPDGNGFFFARDHLAPGQIPFMFLSSQVEESDRILGLELGAMDYISKPFSLKELMMRVKAILNRISPPGYKGGRESRMWTSGGNVLEYTESTHLVKVNHIPVHLTTMEWEIFSFLIHHDGSILSRDQIRKHLQFLSGEISRRTVDSHIKNIRRKLGSPDWILAVRSFGFRFAGEKVFD